MAITLESISKGKAERAPRIILLGTEKVGKSTFASDAPNPIFISVKGEQGVDDLDVAKFPVVSQHGQIIETIGVLYNDDHSHKTVVIDSASALEPIVIDAAMKQECVDSAAKLGGGYGRQDDTPMDLWRQITDGLDALRESKNIASIIIGHVTVKPFTDPLTDSYDTFEWDVRAKVRNMLFRWADCILFANRKAYIKREEIGLNREKTRAASDDSRYLYTQKRPGHPGGGRGVYGRLPYELPLSWSAFQDAIASQTQTKKGN